MKNELTVNEEIELFKRRMKALSPESSAYKFAASHIAMLMKRVNNDGEEKKHIL